MTIQNSSRLQRLPVPYKTYPQIFAPFYVVIQHLQENFCDSLLIYFLPKEITYAFMITEVQLTSFYSIKNSYLHVLRQKHTYALPRAISKPKLTNGERFESVL